MEGALAGVAVVTCTRQQLQEAAVNWLRKMTWKKKVGYSKNLVTYNVPSMNLSHCLSKASTLSSRKLISTVPLCNSVQEDCSFRVNYSSGSEQCADVYIQQSLSGVFFIIFFSVCMAQRVRHGVVVRKIKRLEGMNTSACAGLLCRMEEEFTFTSTFIHNHNSKTILMLNYITSPLFCSFYCNSILNKIHFDMVIVSTRDSALGRIIHELKKKKKRQCSYAP